MSTSELEEIETELAKYRHELAELVNAVEEMSTWMESDFSVAKRLRQQVTRSKARLDYGMR